MKKRNGSKRTMVVMMTAAMAASMGITGMAAGDSGDTITLTWLNHYAEAGKQAWLQSVKEQFEAKYDNVVLNIETVDADNHKTILQTKLAFRRCCRQFLTLQAMRILPIYNDRLSRRFKRF